MKIFPAILYTALFSIGISCGNKNTVKEKNFENSTYFKNTLSLSSSDTPSAYNIIQTALSEINEASFIHAEGYEYYIIGYTYGLLLENRAFIIKKDKLGTHIIFKSGTSKHGRDINLENGCKDFLTLFKSKEISATLNSDTSFTEIKNEIEKLLKKTKQINQDVLNDASSEIFYFNGSDYYKLSNYNLEIEDYYKVSQLIYSIKNTHPFLCLRSSDPTFMSDNQDSIFDYHIQKP